MVLIYFNGFCGGLLMTVVVVVVVVDGGCFRFFAVGCGCHGGASGGSSLWVFGGPVWA